jgi:DNA repair protein RecO (recombination protein O)
MSEREEVLLEPAYVLHQRPYRNSSLIVDCLTARYGRQSLVARGARRADSPQRSLLQSFRRIRLSWVRRGEMGSLQQAEADAPAHELKGDGLLAGFYLNELLLRLVPRGDQNDAILSCYSSCLDRLAAAGNAARALRVFELELLEALGYRVDLGSDFRTGEPIEPDRHYVFEHESGLTASGANTSMEGYSGRHLIALREHCLNDAESLRTARQLLGGILKRHLGERPLKTRLVLREIVERGFARR